MKHIINYLIISLCILFSLNTFGQSNGEEYNYTKNDLTQFIRESILHYLRQPSNIDDNNIVVCIDNIPSEKFTYHNVHTPKVAFSIFRVVELLSLSNSRVVSSPQKKPQT